MLGNPPRLYGQFSQDFKTRLPYKRGALLTPDMLHLNEIEVIFEVLSVDAFALHHLAGYNIS